MTVYPLATSMAENPRIVSKQKRDFHTGLVFSGGGMIAGMLATLKNKLASSVLGGMVDRQPWLYWDTVNAVGELVLPAVQAFQIGRGQVDPVTGRSKTVHDTNMVASGSFGATRCMIVERIGIYFPLWLSDLEINQIMSSAYVRFRIAEKIFWEGRMDVFEKPDTAQEVRENPEGEIFSPAEYSGRTVDARLESKYIAPLIPFNFDIHFASPVVLAFDGVRPVMIPILDGKTDRVVQ